MTSRQLDLPRIPSLPPILMPDATSFLSDSRRHSDKDASSPLRHSSTSIASQDTFQTAPPSPLHDMNGDSPAHSPELLVPTNAQQLVPPISLRKSISVDSFMKHPQLVPLVNRPHRVNTLGSVVHPRPDGPYRASSSSAARAVEPIPPVPAISHRERDRRPPQPPGLSRSRGASISTIADEPDGAFPEESDGERSAEANGAAQKRKSIFRRVVPPGDLGLPSRLQTVSSSPTMGKSPSQVGADRRSAHKLPKQRSLMSVNTHLPPTLKPPHYTSEVAIAVVGARGCGKSTVIWKGLKAQGLSEPTVKSIQTDSRDGKDTFTYTYRNGKVTDQNGSERLLHVLEVDILQLDLTQQRPFAVCPVGAPTIDGMLICYDASQPASFVHVEDVLRTYDCLKLPTVVMACKSDLERRVDPTHATSIISQYGEVGLVEASKAHSLGKENTRKAFDLILKLILSAKLAGRARDDRDSYRNPASPAALFPESPENSRASSATPTASSSIASAHPVHSQVYPHPRIRTTRPPPPSGDGPLSPHTPTSPTRARSMSDLLSEREKHDNRDSEDHEWDQNSTSRNGMLGVAATRSRASLQTGISGTTEGLSSLDEANESNRDTSSRESRPQAWRSLDDLLDKLLFLAVSDDDPTFISHFLLTYRRFTTPRSILLAMQKRMRALDQPTGDPMFACFAQMRICCLLDHWIKLYPNDFAVPGTSGALTALVRSVLGKTYLLHYGSDFIPFIEMVPTLKDKDAGWAMKVEDPKDDSDDNSSVAEAPIRTPDSPISSRTSHSLPDFDSPQPTPTQHSMMRERKQSLPLSAKALVMPPSISPTHVAYTESSDHQSPKSILKKLLTVASELQAIDPNDIAQEITRLESQFFLRIEPRHWLQHVLAPGRKDPETDAIASYNHVSNHIADWVVSLILCHDKPKARARQIEKFIDIANRLRNMNNYSALRAVIAGINSATYEGDPSIEIIRTKSNERYKNFQSWDQLLQAVRSHQKYRMALRNTKGACIPALEIHLSDLIRAHEGNMDFYNEDPSKIHWAKFNMMGRFIDAVTQCQKGCREMGTFQFTERPAIRDLLLFLQDDFLMDSEMQRSRIAPPDFEGADIHPRPNLPRTYSRDYPPHPKDGAIFRKIFFW